MADLDARTSRRLIPCDCPIAWSSLVCWVLMFGRPWRIIITLTVKNDEVAIRIVLRLNLPMPLSSIEIMHFASLTIIQNYVEQRLIQSAQMPVRHYQKVD